MSVPQPQYKIIAGKNAGNKVIAKTPQIAAACAELAKMARDGNHWARISVNYINALTSRQMKTVFVREGVKTADNRQLFVMLMPGISMEFSQHANSDYVIHSMVLDTTYSKLQKNLEKPGLFRIKKEDGEYKAQLVDQVLPDKGRVITVSDRSNDLMMAMIDSARAAKEPMGNSVIDRFGFDMHFTPGEGKIGGLKRRESQKSEHSKALRESAVLLAKTMEESRKIEGIYWVSQGGGSGVLTQALHILKSRKVSFDNSGHHVFLSGPATNIIKAQQLAYDLNLKFERKAYSVGIHTNISDIIKAPWQRRQRDPENYSRLQMGIDMCKGPQVVIGGVALASSFGLGGLGGFIVGAGVAGFTALAALTKIASPNTHNKIEEKF